jgi:hypothetical protein
MCILDIPQACGRGIPGIFLTPQYAWMVNHNNMRPCPAILPTQSPVNCVDFRVQHGSSPYKFDCAACTNGIKSNPPPPFHTRQVPVQSSPYLGSPDQGPYHDRPPPPRTNTEQHASNPPCIPGLSSWATSHAEGSRPTPQTPQEGPSSHPNQTNRVNPAPGGFNMSPLRSAVRSPRNYHTIPQQAQTSYFNPPAPPVRPRSASRHRNRYDDPTEDLKRLLDDALEYNSVLTKENEKLKQENANLRRRVEQNRPRYEHRS